MKALLLGMLLPVALHAQKPVDSATIQQVRSFDRNFSKPKEGAMLPEFEGLTIAGAPFSLSNLRQHVSIVAFWYPSCGCFKPDVLEPFREFAANPRFQLVSIMPDSFSYAGFIRGHPVPGIHVNMNSHARCNELSLNSPYPTVMLIDANGRILKASSFHRRLFDEAEWLARVREALLF